MSLELPPRPATGDAPSISDTVTVARDSSSSSPAPSTHEKEKQRDIISYDEDSLGGALMRHKAAAGKEKRLDVAWRSLSVRGIGKDAVYGETMGVRTLPTNF